jgi:hypothetical protein
MFMPKPPFLEALWFAASPRMLRFLLIVLFGLAIPTVGANLAREFLLPPPAAGVPIGVPPLDWTTSGSRYSSPLAMVIPGEIPDKPGPNQKRKCNPKRSEVEINGGCWVKTDHPLPCPEGEQWEHKKRCWLPVAYAAEPPTSGEPLRVNIAGSD